MKKKPSEGRLWIRLWKGHRFVRDWTVPCAHDDVQAAMREGLRALDLGAPIWLPRHEADWREFSLTRFRPEHFLEAVDFDYMEISYIFPEDAEKPRRHSEEWD